jgi:hypothetical protein
VILIVTFPDNEHVEEVRQHLTAPHVLVDVAWFPTQLRLTAEAEGDRSRIALRHPTGQRIDLADVGAIWYRRIRPYDLSPDLADDTSRLFAWSECNEALLGVWYTLPCFWMNSPLAAFHSGDAVRVPSS